jgi:O-antigen/teichoic acid export membrane protein
LGTALGRALYIAGLVLAARLLGRDDYGRLWAVYSMVLYFGALAGGGFGVAAAKLVAEYRSQSPDKAGAAAGRLLSAMAIIGLAAAALLWASAGWVAGKLLISTDLAGTLRLSAVLFPLAALQAAQAGVLTGTESFRQLAMASAAQGAIFATLAAWLAGTLGLTGAIWAMAASGLAVCVLQQSLVSKELSRFGIRLALSVPGGRSPLILRPALILSLAGLATAAAFWAINAVLASRPGGFGEMGIVNIGMQWMNAVLFVPSLLAQVGLPILAERGAGGDSDGFRRALGHNLALVAAISIISAGAVAGAGGIILGFYGPGFASGRAVLTVMALAGFISALSLPACNRLLAEGRFGRYFLLNLAWSVALVASFALLAEQGALGLAWAQLAAGVVFLAGTWAVTNSKLK